LLSNWKYVVNLHWMNLGREGCVGVVRVLEFSRIDMHRLAASFEPLGDMGNNRGWLCSECSEDGNWTSSHWSVQGKDEICGSRVEV